MSRQDKATTDRHARTLRELVKQPDNKSCADCRKNDARWASWNLGVFLCIRCSGIHRSMGTHISKVKSIDLDMWTPEQMESIQKWGNTRANLYWEKHLKAGHVPPDHKIESFIRSKYESKRWAMDGPPPSDPSVLEQGGGHAPQAAPAAAPTRPTPTSSAPAAAPAARGTHPLLSRQTAAAKAAPSPAPLFDLIGDDPSPAPVSAPTTVPAATAATAPPQAAAASTAGAAPPAPTAVPSSNIFDLDFRAPTPQTSKPQTAKSDIMSLFSMSSPSASASTPAQSQAQGQHSFFAPPPAQDNFGSWGGGITSSAPPVQQSNQVHLGAAVGAGGASASASNGGWGGMQMEQNAWGAPAQNHSQPQHQQQSYQYQPPQQQYQPQQPAASTAGANMWGGAAPTNDPWASAGNGTAAGSSGGFGAFGGAAPPQKKEEVDPFANIWK